MEVCRGCDKFSENRRQAGHKIVRIDEHCTDCGCPLISKTRCLSCECPLKKWTATMSQNDEQEFKQKIEEYGKEA